jgi:hypothetical protein
MSYEIIETQHGKGKTKRMIRYDKGMYKIPRVNQGQDGRRFIKFKKKRIYLDDDITERELIKFIISQLAPKKRKVLRYPKKPKCGVGFPKGDVVTGSSTPIIVTALNSKNDTQISQLKEEIQNLKLLKSDNVKLNTKLLKTEEMLPTLSGIELRAKFKALKINKSEIAKICSQQFGLSKSAYLGLKIDKLCEVLAKIGYNPDDHKSNVVIEEVVDPSVYQGIAIQNQIEPEDNFYLNSPISKRKLNSKLNKEKEEKEEEEDNEESSTLRLEEEDLAGNGGKSVNKSGLDTDQINEIMKPYRPEYLGCIGSDQIPSLISHVKPDTRVCWVMNTEPSTEDGDHWCSILIDCRPEGSGSIEFYNPLGIKDRRRITAQFIRNIVPLLDKINPMEKPLKLKENLITDQSNTSSNCGFFAVHFLIDRLSRNKSFSQATGYDKLGEQMIEMYKDHLYKFKYLTQNGRGIVQKIKDGYNYIKGKFKKVLDTAKERVTDVLSNGLREDMPPSGRKILEEHSGEVITEIVVARVPIKAWLNKVINWVSNGQFEQNLKELNYDKAFHLMMGIRTSNNSYLTEKNEVVKLIKESWSGGDKNKSDAQRMVVKVTKRITLAELFNKSVDKYGKNRIFIYDSRNDNCQQFISDLISSSGLMTNALHTFIMQDAETIYKDMGLLGMVNRKVTDLAAGVNVVLEGRGR